MQSQATLQKKITRLDKDTFARSLTEARDAAGMTQEQAVEYLKKQGISVSLRALAGYERGENMPPTVKAESILQAMSKIAGKGNECATQNDEPEDLVSVPVYGDASAGPGRTVHAEPLRYRQVTRDQYFHDFQQAPDGRRFAYWRVVGDSAVPIYFDQEEVPVEVLPPGTQQFKNDTVYVFRWMDDVMIKRLRRRPDGTIQAFSLNPGIPVYEFRPAEHDFEVLGRVIGPPKQQLYAALVARAFEIQREVWSTIAAAERGRGSDA